MEVDTDACEVQALLVERTEARSRLTRYAPWLMGCGLVIVGIGFTVCRAGSTDISARSDISFTRLWWVGEAERDKDVYESTVEANQNAAKKVRDELGKYIKDADLVEQLAGHNPGKLLKEIQKSETEAREREEMVAQLAEQQDKDRAVKCSTETEAKDRTKCLKAMCEGRPEKEKTVCLNREVCAGTDQEKRACETEKCKRLEEGKKSTCLSDVKCPGDDSLEDVNCAVSKCVNGDADKRTECLEKGICSTFPDSYAAGKAQCLKGEEVECPEGDKLGSINCKIEMCVKGDADKRNDCLKDGVCKTLPDMFKDSKAACDLGEKVKCPEGDDMASINCQIENCPSIDADKTESCLSGVCSNLPAFFNKEECKAGTDVKCPEEGSASINCQIEECKKGDPDQKESCLSDKACNNLPAFFNKEECKAGTHVKCPEEGSASINCQIEECKTGEPDKKESCLSDKACNSLPAFFNEEECKAGTHVKCPEKGSASINCQIEECKTGEPDQKESCLSDKACNDLPAFFNEEECKAGTHVKCPEGGNIASINCQIEECKTGEPDQKESCLSDKACNSLPAFFNEEECKAGTHVKCPEGGSASINCQIEECKTGEPDQKESCLSDKACNSLPAFFNEEECKAGTHVKCPEKYASSINCQIEECKKGDPDKKESCLSETACNAFPAYLDNEQKCKDGSTVSCNDKPEYKHNDDKELVNCHITSCNEETDKQSCLNTFCDKLKGDLQAKKQKCKDGELLA